MFGAWTKPDGRPAPSSESNARGLTSTIVVIARGELDTATAPTLSALLSAHVGAGITDIDLHTGGLVFCDAAGLSVMAIIERGLATRGGALRVVDAPPMLRRLLEITDLEFLLADRRGDPRDEHDTTGHGPGSASSPDTAGLHTRPRSAPGAARPDRTGGPVSPRPLRIQPPGDTPSSSSIVDRRQTIR